MTAATPCCPLHREIQSLNKLLKVLITLLLQASCVHIVRGVNMKSVVRSSVQFGDEEDAQLAATKYVNMTKTRNGPVAWLPSQVWSHLGVLHCLLMTTQH